MTLLDPHLFLSQILLLLLASKINGFPVNEVRVTYNRHSIYRYNKIITRVDLRTGENLPF